MMTKKVFGFVLFLFLMAFTLNAGRSYDFKGLSFEYDQHNSNFPSLADFENETVNLVNEEGVYIPSDDGEIRIADLKQGELSAKAVSVIVNQLINYVHERGLIGVIVNYSGDEPLIFVVTPKKISQFNTVAFGERFDNENDAKQAHEVIKNSSPILNDPYLNIDRLDVFISRLNRHPGRDIQVHVSPDGDENIIVEYMVKERKPWMAHATIMNTGNKQTKYWNEVFGFIHRQLTSNDDIFSVTYHTAGFKNIHSVMMDYYRPFSLGSPNYLKCDLSWDKLEAASLGFKGKEFVTQGLKGRVELSRIIYQDKDRFIDCFGALGVRNIKVVNNLTTEKGHTNFLIPEIGLKLHQRTFRKKISASLGLGGNFADLIGTKASELENFGRDNISRSWQKINMDLFYSVYFSNLREVFSLCDLAGPRPDNELVWKLNGQYAFKYRVIPQCRGVLGGMYTVRGYREAIASGDTFWNSQLTYKRLLINKFNTDFKGLLFCDYGRTINNRKNPEGTEKNYTLSSAGVGFEIHHDYMILNVDYGMALKSFSPPNYPDRQKAGEGRFNLSGTILY